MDEPYSPVTDDYALWSCEDEDATETEVIQLLGALVATTKPKICVEVGAYTGLSSFEIGIALKRNGRGHLHSFEIDPRHAATAAERTAGLPVTVHPIADTEYDPANLEEPVGFLFVDGDLDNRSSSLVHWRPWLSSNSIVAVHDSLKWYDVQLAIESVEYLQRIDIVTPRGLTLMTLAPEA